MQKTKSEAEKKHLYVLKTHPCTWLMSLCMAAAIVCMLLTPTEKATGLAPLPEAALPCLAMLSFTLIAVFSGDELLHRTAYPVWLLGLCFAFSEGKALIWAACLLFCAVYTHAVRAKIHKAWLLALYLPALLGCVFLGKLPYILTVLSLILLLPAMKTHKDGKWHPCHKDRIDGRYVRSAQVMEQITAFFMPNRTGANNLFSESVEISALERYIRRKRSEGMPGFGVTHVMLAAYVRTVAKYPALNRFIAGQRIYSRGEDITVCMTVKKELTASAPDSLVKVHLHPGDTAADVYRKFNEKLSEAKNEPETSQDSAAAAFMAIPRLLLKFIIWLLKALDYFGLVPGFLLELSPFHGSVYFTNMGSLGIKPVYHHLYDFGTVPVFCAFGRKRKAEELHNGEAVQRKYLDLKFNLDERICDGFYYANVIKYFLRLLSSPDVLDEAPESIACDIP